MSNDRPAFELRDLRANVHIRIWADGRVTGWPFPTCVIINRIPQLIYAAEREGRAA